MLLTWIVAQIRSLCNRRKDRYTMKNPIVLTSAEREAYLGRVTEHVPDGLMRLPNWVAYKLVPNPKPDNPHKTNKLPINPHNGRMASSTDPATWGTVQQAYDFLRSDGGRDCYGLGFMLGTKEQPSGIVGFDADNCVNGAGEVTSDQARQFVDILDTYTEISPSGRGLRCFALGTLPPNGRKRGDFEFYSDQRFLTVTGHCIHSSIVLNSDQAAIDRVHGLIWPTSEQAATSKRGVVNGAGGSSSNTLSLDDQAIIDLARGAANGAKFESVWSGNDTYSSPSEGDGALFKLLGFYTQDPAQIERIARQSSRERDKWDEPRGNQTWVQRDILSAIDGLTNTYSPGTLHSTNGDASETAVNGAGGATPQRDYLTYPADDGGILDAFLDIYGDGWLYTNLGGWYRWAGTHWAMQKTDAAIKRVVMRLMVDMNAHAKQARKELKTAVETNPAAKEKSDAAKAMIRATRRSAARVNSVAVMAAAVLDQPQDTLDAIGKLNLQNGTLDLETGDLTQHDAGDYLTYCLPYEYNPAANCPNWLHVLRGIANSLGDETVDFLQEFAGYCLTPDTSHELAVWLHGQPGGGKSTFLAGLQTMLGPKSGLLGLADIERNTFALANLPGKTMVVSTEQPSMYLASGHILNAIISGEPVMVNRKFRDAVEVQPVAKLAWAMNELPRISDANNGLFRRVKVVSFAPIAPSDRRPELKAGLAREGAGILNWALRGLERLTQRGYFIVPQVVEDSTVEFQSENDIMGLFMAECCVTDLDAKVQSSLLYNEYKEWASDNGYKPLNAVNAAKEWRRLGLTKTRITGRSYWKGVGLLERDMRDLEKDDGKGEGENDS